MSFGCERSCSSPRRVSNFNSKVPQREMSSGSTGGGDAKTIISQNTSFGDITRGLSAWQLRRLIVYATLMISNYLWYTAKLIPNDLDLTFQCHPKSNVMGVNWKTIYDLLCVHAKFDKKMLHLRDATFWKSCDLDFTLKGYPMSIVLR